MPHIHEDIDLTASVYIVHENKVLLVLHKKLGSWLPVGGHVELNEDAHEALMREIEEECGLSVDLICAPLPELPDASDVKFLPVPSYFDIHRINNEHRHMNLVYFGTSSTDKAMLTHGEHNDLRWFSLEEIENQDLEIRPNARFYAKEALKQANK